MKYNVDHYFHIGHMHYISGKPCQDHALSKSDEVYASGIVSDGCSTGGNTDVGSRIISCSTLQAISDHKEASPYSLETAAESIQIRQQQIISGIRPILGLKYDDMFATCVYVYVTPFGGLLFFHGDGAYAIKYKSGHIRMGKYEWENNMPFYPAYSGNNLNAFIQAQKISTNPYMHTGLVFSNTDTLIDDIEDQYSIEEGIKGIQIRFSKEQLNEIEYIAIFTDGVLQVDGIQWFDAIKKFVAYKNNSGEFCKRRMMRAIKDFQVNGKGPQDDVACAVVHISEGETQWE